MEIYHAGPYDQHIYLENHELVDDMSTLATLGIHPFDLLKLKVCFFQYFITFFFKS